MQKEILLIKRTCRNHADKIVNKFFVNKNLKEAIYDDFKKASTKIMVSYLRFICIEEVISKILKREPKLQKAKKSKLIISKINYRLEQALVEIENLAHTI